MVVEIIRKWTDKGGKFQFGQDINGTLYCKDIENNKNLVLMDNFFRKGGRTYYKFIYPDTKKIKLVER